nr:uracil phosphoribosyltransferase [Tanacetum cinerariifolium]
MMASSRFLQIQTGCPPDLHNFTFSPTNLSPNNNNLSYYNKRQHLHRSMPLQATVFVPPHPLIKHWVSVLRNEQTPCPIFKNAMAELGRLLMYEASRDWLPTVSGEIQSPLGVAEVEFIDPREPIAVIPILRAGLALAEHASSILPATKTYHLGVSRNEETLEPTVYLNKLPDKFSEGTRVFIVDPMLATGGTIVAAIDLVKERGVDNQHIKVVSAVACPPALQKLSEKYPGLHVYAGIIDPTLTDKGMIIPGLGDAGDRSFEILLKEFMRIESFYLKFHMNMTGIMFSHRQNRGPAEAVFLVNVRALPEDLNPFLFGDDTLFEWLDKQGKHNISALEFSYFDPILEDLSLWDCFNSSLPLLCLKDDNTTQSHGFSGEAYSSSSGTTITTSTTTAIVNHGDRSGRKRVSPLEFEEIKKHFEMPLAVAAKELNDMGLKEIEMLEGQKRMMRNNQRWN